MMKKIETLFDLYRAKSDLLSNYESGPVAYIGNGLDDNGVNGFVTPKASDRIFKQRSIVISAFCEASVQLPPFVACGRAGNGLTVLVSKSPVSLTYLAYVAAYINLAVKWRFNWYRQVTLDRIRAIEVPWTVPNGHTFDVKKIVPTPSVVESELHQITLHPFTLDQLFAMKAGDIHNLSIHESGELPVISCGAANNGVSGFIKEYEHTYQGKMTIAFNGMNTLTAMYHPYVFAAKDDVAVCTPRSPMHLSTLFFIQMMINREKWRYSYYRKCFLDKLRRFEILLPVCNGEVDEGYMKKLAEATPYWSYLIDQQTPDVTPKQMNDVGTANSNSVALIK